MLLQPGSRPSGRPPAAAVATFLDAMSEVAGGVMLVTCVVDGRPWGMTVTAFHSVSIEPPTVLVTLGSRTTTAAAIADSGSFGVDVLADTHILLARYASVPGAAKYLERYTAPEADTAAPAVAGALAHLDCEAFDAVYVADHIVFFAHVLAARASRDAPPLVHHRRAYRTLRPHEGGRHADR